MASEMSQTHVLVLVRPTVKHHSLIRELHKAYGFPAPPMPDEAIIVTQDDAVVASCYLFNAAAFSIAEFFVTNPAFSLRLRHQASEIVLEQWLSRCVSRGSLPTCTPRTKGMKHALRRWGMRDTGHTMYVSDDIQIPVTTKRRTLAIEQREGSSRNVRAPRPGRGGAPKVGSKKKAVKRKAGS